MSNIYRALLLVIAGAAQKELARQVKYLKVENQILRSRLPRQVFVTPKERHRLLKFAGKLSAKVLHQLVTIVHPETLLRWLREERRGKHKLDSANRGRPKTPAQLRRLILKLARENDWGYTRIMGEIKKLGIKPPSRNTVKNILKAAGLDPGPQRGEATWDEFLTRHASSLWQCDFFSRRVLTPRGFRQVFVLTFLNVETRRVILSPATYQPDSEWVEAQAQAFVAQAREAGLPVARVMRDRDSKFGKLDWVRQQLRDNPLVVMEAPYPDYALDDAANGIPWDSSAGEGPWDYGELSGWYRKAEAEKRIFESRRDILEGLVACGADPNTGSVLFYAVQHFDTSLAEWLLERGADPNRDLKRGTATYLPDIARTRRMVNLLKRYGAVENPYPRELDEWEQETQRLKEQFV